MDSRNLIRFLFLIFIIALLLLLTLTTIRYSGELPDCSTNSRWCISFPSTIKQPPEPTPRLHTADVPHHPLDPLTLTELNRVRSILLSHALFKNSNTYALHSVVVVEEPDKPAVLTWKHGDALPPRKASVIARVNRGEAHVLTVDIATGDVTPVDVGQHSGNYPTMTIDEMTSSTWAPLGNAEFNRTIMARGMDLKDLACLPVSIGWFGKKEEGRRLIKIQCYSMEGTANSYMRPIEGLTVVLDMYTKQVVEITDKVKSTPVPKAAGTDYRFSALENKISIEQPKGPGFIIENDHLVKWANWEFHLKPDPRAGVVISRARVRDPKTGEIRSVINGFASELFGLYMDAGEYGFGLHAMPLDPLNDCPRNAYYMDGVFAAGDGKPYVRPNMVCVYESYTDDIGWWHSESPFTRMEIRELRPKVTLVVRMAASVANYDYIIDLEFQTNGLIRVKEHRDSTIKHVPALMTTRNNLTGLNGQHEKDTWMG